VDAAYKMQATMPPCGLLNETWEERGQVIKGDGCGHHSVGAAH